MSQQPFESCHLEHPEFRKHIVKEDLQVPEGYFDALADHLSDAQSMTSSDDTTKPDLIVPDGFFEAQERALMQRTSARGRLIPIARWGARIAAAAILALTIFQLAEQHPGPQRASVFTAMLNAEPVTTADLEFFATEHEYDELLKSTLAELSDDEQWLMIPDSLILIDIGSSENDNSEKKTTDEGDVKPPSTEATPTFEELSHEEIIEYLMYEAEWNW